MQKKLRVCFVTEDFFPSFIGGQGIYGRHIVDQLAHLGLEMTVFAETRKGRVGFWKGRKNIILHLAPYCWGNQLVLGLLQYCLFIILYRKKYFDIVHGNQLSTLFFVLFRPRNIGKVIVSVHNTNYDMASSEKNALKRLCYSPLIWLERLMYRNADALLFNSPQEQKALQNYFKISNKPSASIYLGVKTPRFSKKVQNQARRQIRRDLGIAMSSKIVLYLGRLVHRKRVDAVLTAMKYLFKDGSRTYGVIIGRGREKERLKRLAPANVFFLDFVRDTKSYFLAADCFVTVSEAEGGFSLAVLEAASFGLPLIVSPSVAGFPIVKEGKNGFIVDPDNYQILAKKITHVLTHSRKMGQESLKYAKHFTWENCARQTLRFYRSLL